MLEANVTLPDRTAVVEAATTVRLREAALKLVEAQKKPSASLNSSYGRIAYPDNGLPTFDRANWTVGASMTVPILTGGRQRGDEAVALAELEQAKSQRKQVEELAALDTRSSWAELIAARVAWEATARDDSASTARIPDRQRALHQRRVHAARTVGCAVIAATGRSESDCGRAGPAGRARACRAVAEPSGLRCRPGSACRRRACRSRSLQRCPHHHNRRLAVRFETRPRRERSHR